MHWLVSRFKHITISPWVWLFACVAVLSLSLWIRLDPDLGWHLRLAQYMHEHNQLVDQLIGYNQVFFGRTLIDHQWLSHYLIYPLYQWGGYPLLMLISAVVALITLAFIYSRSRRFANQGWALVVTIICAHGLVINFGVRIQLILIMAAAMLLWIPQGIANWKHRSLAYFTIFILGTNLHGGFVILLSIPFFLEMRRPIREYVLTILPGISGLFLTPWGIRFWQLSLDYIRDTTYKQSIAEWLPLFNDLNQSWQYLFVVVPLIISLIAINKTWKQVTLSEKILLCLFIFLGVRYIRFYSLALFVLAPWIAKSLHDQFPTARRASMMSALVLVLIFASAQLSEFWPYRAYYSQFPSPTTLPGFPHGAARFADTQPRCRDRLANTYNWGGYLAGFHPTLPVLVDGRGPQLSIDGSSTILQRTSELFYGDTAASSQRITEYQLTCFLIETPHPYTLSWLDRLLGTRSQRDADQITADQRQLYDWLSNQPEWNLAYTDTLATVFIRTTPY